MSKNKTAIVTGSTSGIGKGIAQVMAENNYNIVINGFGDNNEIEELISSLQKNGVKASYSNADMTKPDQIDEMVNKTIKEFGSIDLLVNNAGIQHVDNIEDFPNEKWDAIIAINLSSSFHTMKAVIPHMKKRGYGRIVNIASAHGLVASPMKAAYVAAKHGVVGLTKVVALENAEADITCNAICPGWVLTPLVQKQIDAISKNEGISIKDAEIKLLSEKQPSKKFVQVNQIGNMVKYLCSDEASTITGSSISIDGGWTAK
jgi:3-hydroxybutyrate dehydrogenase